MSLRQMIKIIATADRTAGATPTRTNDGAGAATDVMVKDG